jgi:ABC-type transport system involved in cytochrome c biogenesis permease subunit
MHNFLNGITLLGIPAIILVPVIVQGIKALGLPARWAGLVALIVGLVVAGLAEAVTAWPSVTPLVRFLVAGVLLGFAAAGSYSQYKVFKR